MSHRKPSSNQRKLPHYIKEAEKYGIRVKDNQVDFGRVMAYVRSTQHTIEQEHDNPERFREMGVNVIFGEGHFESPGTFVVQDRESDQTLTLKSKKFVITTGSRPTAPDIPGMDSDDYLDSENVWELDQLPERLLVIGAGPIGIELGQAFHRLGAEVTIAQRSDRILTKEDTEVSEKMLSYLQEDGIEILLNTNPVQVEQIKAPFSEELNPDIAVWGPQDTEASEEYRVQLKTTDTGDEREIVVDRILIAAGRKPNIEGLGLEKIGVKVGKRGVEVNNKLQTTVKNIYAAGDVVGHYLFTHVAAFQATQIVRNIFFPGSSAINYSVVPWTTFCDPEVARCGLTEAEAREEHGDVDVFRVDLHDVDRAVAEGETKGVYQSRCNPLEGQNLRRPPSRTKRGRGYPRVCSSDECGHPITEVGGNHPRLSDVFEHCLACCWKVARRRHLDPNTTRDIQERKLTFGCYFAEIVI